MTTLEKVRRLEEYLAINDAYIDPIVEITIDKILVRELDRMAELRARLAEDLAVFEKQYTLKSEDFQLRYEAGEMGDEADFVEWSATIEMLGNIQRQATILQTATN